MEKKETRFALDNRTGTDPSAKFVLVVYDNLREQECGGVKEAGEEVKADRRWSVELYGARKSLASKELAMDFLQECMEERETKAKWIEVDTYHALLVLNYDEQIIGEIIVEPLTETYNRFIARSKRGSAHFINRQSAERWLLDSTDC